MEHRVNSSMISALDYNAGDHSLKVTFRDKQTGSDGQQWVYRGVNPDVYSALTSSDSVGSAFGKLIRNKYQQERLT